MTERYDVIVIGAGPAGYVAAIRCSQLGMKTAVVDSWLDKAGAPVLGGTCLNVGCIPSKALLDTSERFHQIKHTSPSHGIQVKGATIDIKAMMARKDAVVSQLTSGVAGLFKANDIDWLQGTGTLLTDNKISVISHDGKQYEHTASDIIIASGSVPYNIPSARCDGKYIVDSSGALEFPSVPKKLVVIGAGVIGLELGSVWNRLGSEVVLLEAQSDFLAAADKQISREALRQFKSQGLDIRLDARVIATSIKSGKVAISYEDADGFQELKADRVLVAAGRMPYTKNLFDAKLGIAIDDRGFIKVDEYCRTSIPHVYAIGDVVLGPMLAHKGSEEGVAVAEIIAGHNVSISHQHMPWVMYTDPEIAWVGQTEQSLKDRGIQYTSGMFSMSATGRALAMDAGAGFVKIIADARTDLILGVHIIARSASELIAEAVLAMEFDASAEDLARTIHAHPTLSEAIHEAALDVAGRAIHKAGRKRK